jgi:hypothetical protein
MFVDAAKDGAFEVDLLRSFRRVGLRQGTRLVFDDIRLWNMLSFWRHLELPKLDLTSFGDFTGTGLAEWVDGRTDRRTFVTTRCGE